MSSAPDQSSIAIFWHQALQRGLFPLPIAAGTKSPMLSTWAKDLQPLQSPPAGTASVGIRCLAGDPVGAIDVDCSHAETLGYFRHVFGEHVPVRWGRKPRFLIPFYKGDAIEGRNFKMACGCKLQILDGQFIAFGPHENLRDTYEWANIGIEWPRFTRLDLFTRLAFLHVDVTRAFGEAAEDASIDFINAAAPRTQEEQQAIAQYAVQRLIDMSGKLRGMTEGRGTVVYETTAHIAPAVHWGAVSRAMIEDAISNAGHGLDDKHGGRSLGEEITRGVNSPVRTDNPTLATVLQRREIMKSIFREDRTLADVMAKRIDPLKFAVENILPQGLVIFAARPKFGKSFIMVDLSDAVTEGATFWGQQCIQGDVLWFDFEGTERRTQDRMRVVRPNGTKSSYRVRIWYGEDKIPRISLQPGVPGFLEFLEAKLQQYPNTRLVIIDTLINIRPDARDKNQQLYQMDYEATAGLQRLLGKYGVACICVHHTRKSGEAQSIIERVSGSMGLTGAADGVWTVEEKDGIASLHTNMRDVKDFDCELVRGEDAVWRPKGDSMPGQQDGNHKAAILSAMMAAGCECTAGDIAARTGIAVEIVRVYMHRMKGKEVEGTTRGVFKLANSAPKSRPEGARDLLVAARTEGGYADFQAGRMVDVREVLPHMSSPDRCPVMEGLAVSMDSARGILAAFDDADRIIKDMESRKLAFVFDKVLLVPYTAAQITPTAAPQAWPWTLQGALQQKAKYPWE